MRRAALWACAQIGADLVFSFLKGELHFPRDFCRRWLLPPLVLIGLRPARPVVAPGAVRGPHFFGFRSGSVPSEGHWTPPWAKRLGLLPCGSVGAALPRETPRGH